MNRILFLALLLGAPLAATPASAQAAAPASEAGYSAEHWARFSRQVARGLRSGNAGVRAASLRHVAAYGDRLDLGPAADDVARLYREADDEGTQLLALSALSRLEGAWVTDYLSERARVEPSERVRRLTLAAVAQRQSR